MRSGAETAETLLETELEMEIEIGVDVEVVAPANEAPALALASANANVALIDFRRLYEKNVSFVWRNLRRLGTWPNDLEDRTQEVFMVAFRRLPTFEDRGFGARVSDYAVDAVGSKSPLHGTRR